MANLTIQIDGDAKGYEDALKKSENDTAEFSDRVKHATEASAVAFAALTAEIGFSVKAFGAGQQATRFLTAEMQNQGVFSDALVEKYKKQREAISDLTGVDTNAIAHAQAIAQSYLGRTEVTGELTKAIVDLAAVEGGDLDAAATKVAKTIATGTNVFRDHSLQFAATSTQAERYAKVLDFVNVKAGGQADVTNKSVTSMQALETEFSNVQEQIGSKFAPAVGIAIAALTNFLKAAKNNDAFVTFASGILAGGEALTSVVSGCATAAIALNSLIGVLKAVEIEISLTKIAVIGLAGATGIGLLVVALGTLGAFLINRTKELEDFKKNLPGARDEIARLNAEIANLEKNGRRTGAGELLIDVQAQIAIRQKRIDSIKASTAEEEKIEAAKLAKKNELSKKEDALRKEHQALEVAAQQAQNQVLEEENLNHSANLLAILTKEAETKSKLAQTQDKDEQTVLRYRLDILSKEEEEQRQQDSERFKLYLKEKIDVEQEMYEKYGDTQTVLSKKQEADILASRNTELDTLRNMEAQRLKDKVAADNQYLEDQKKFGAAYATINMAMHSDIYNATKTAATDLAALQQSSNSTLKAIGKGAAIANITIQTAEAAMAIYTGFVTSLPPYIGIPLGIAGAAAAVAFGAEEIGQVTAAADGGLMTGGRRGFDSIPTITMPGEVIAPARNYDELIGSVAASREAKKSGLLGGGGDNSAILQEISAKLDNRGGDNHFHGDILADNSYIELLTKKISDHLQYRNGKMFGVTFGT